MIKRIIPLFLLVFLVNCGSNTNQGSQKKTSSADRPDFPWYNPEISFEERVDLLISEMTIEEKISQLTHDAAAIERLGCFPGT